MTRITLFFFAFLLVLTAGCGSDDKKETSSPDNNTNQPDLTNNMDQGGSTFLEEYRAARQKLIDARCEMIFSCCGTDERQSLSQAESLAACKDTVFSALQLDPHYAVEAYEQGRITLNSENATLCAQEFAAQDCSTWSKTDPARSGLPGCDEIIIPALEEGEPCGFESECKTSYCSVMGDNNVCEKLGALGESCGTTPCATDGYCKGMVCIERLAHGESCTSHNQCQSHLCSRSEDGQSVCGVAICAGG